MDSICRRLCHISGHMFLDMIGFTILSLVSHYWYTFFVWCYLSIPTLVFSKQKDAVTYFDAIQDIMTCLICNYISYTFVILSVIYLSISAHFLSGHQLDQIHEQRENKKRAFFYSLHFPWCMISYRTVTFKMAYIQGFAQRYLRRHLPQFP